ncbi:MAG: hypothetical protein R3337_00205 [Gammaproteobacteria bacterium]|nr:hypothetical protein [Gammaproteobacteria bacterium]
MSLSTKLPGEVYSYGNGRLCVKADCGTGEPTILFGPLANECFQAAFARLGPGKVEIEITFRTVEESSR